MTAPTAVPAYEPVPRPPKFPHVPENERWTCNTPMFGRIKRGTMWQPKGSALREFPS